MKGMDEVREADQKGGNTDYDDHLQMVPALHSYSYLSITLKSLPKQARDNLIAIHPKRENF